LRNLKPGYKHVIRVKIKRCGAYLGPNKTNWRQFMCHNLGANYNLDPFVPSANIHGDKYQWGYKTPYIKQKDDVYKTGNVIGWNRVEKPNTWNNGIDDPCPGGYRVPSKEEWDAVLKYNSRIRIGTWSGNLGKNANAGIKFGENLMLPTAGARNEFGATTDNLPGFVLYWSTSMAYVNKGRTYYIAFNYDITYPKTVERDFSDAMPVRCIKK